MKRQLIIAAIAISVINPSLVRAQSNDVTPSLFKLEIGMERKAAYEKQPRLSIMYDGRGFNDEYMIGDIPIKVKTVSLDDKIENIAGDFPEHHFQTILEALVSKYGKGEEKISTIQNRAGAEFQQVEVTWTFKNGILSIERYYTTIDVSHVSLISYKFLDTFTKERKKDIGIIKEGL